MDKGALKCFCRKDFWPFIHCMDEEGQEQDLEVGSNCAKQQGLDWDKIKTCTDGSLGTQLQMMAYNTTSNLNPPHRYTPWVTVNGKVHMAIIITINYFFLFVA